MYKQTSKDEAKGKTLQNIYISSPNIIISFEDETFCSFKAEDEYGAIYIVENEKDINEMSYCTVEAGIISEEEFKELAKRRHEEWKEKQLKWKREEFERLKRELGE